ncbi:F-box-like domain protein [Ceratobasidium sp. AG-Ba]|nr:F-box-like domain protein [Ceratobasidium sp. AG-Ba]
MDLFRVLSDDVLLLIFVQLDDPAALSATSRRFYNISREPYTRALYFITRYGYQYAIYWALGRGKLVDPQMLDILVNSGAHISRYLVQCMIQYRGHSAPHGFIKRQWSHSLSFESFIHFLNIAHRKLGYRDLEWAKNADDGAVFRQWLSDKKSHASRTRVNWEVIQEMFQIYGFIPFCPKDPLVLEFPLALSYEPRLLPLAVANGFRIDVKYRDFIFRRVFEKPTAVREGREDAIIKMVGDLQRLDPIRTVAAEVCMEAKSNEQGYTALKKLDGTRKLPYRLSSLVSALIKLFSNTRSITFPKTISLIQSLHLDFPSHGDPKIRHVLLLTVFCSPMNMQWSDETHGILMPKLLEKLAELHLIRQIPSTGGSAASSKVRGNGHALPPKALSRDELIDVLLSPFTENERSCIAYARDPLGMALNDWEIVQLKGDVAVRCLPISSKGKMLKRLCEDKRIEACVAEAMKSYTIRLEDLPDSFSPDCTTYRAALGASLPVIGLDLYGLVPLWATHTEEDESETEVKSEGEKSTASLSDGNAQRSIFTSVNRDLGTISQDTLTARLDRDESGTRWNRRRWWPHNQGIHSMPSELEAKLPYPASPRHVTEHILEHFKSDSRAAAIMMTHCVINGNGLAVQQYIEENVPITLFHFKVLARLGRQPCRSFWQKVDSQAFYFSEDDYLPPETIKPPSSDKMSINTLCNPDPTKPERFQTPDTTIGSEEGFSSSGRPRRQAASATRSYKIPTESDEEAIEETEHLFPAAVKSRGKGKGKSNITERSPAFQSESTSLHLWTKHLGLLLKEEEKKWKERKRLAERDHGRSKERVFKTDFMRSLASRIVALRQRDRASTPIPVIEDDSDDEYVQRPAARTKRKLHNSRWSDQDRTPKRFKAGSE